ncbi:hypothetical protein [Actinomadura vinacea]|uniref:hypothetical protein n=1 Tax=Actinomadura vinacea TaxID=115336 RepID=UPI0031E0DE7A
MSEYGDGLDQVISRRIQGAFLGWNVLVSDVGRWWATRGPLDRTQLRAGWEASLDADTPGQLCERLADEAVRDRRRLGRWGV